MTEKPLKSIKQIIKEDGRYPLEAVEFIREGLSYTMEKFLPRQKPGKPGAAQEIEFNKPTTSKPGFNNLPERDRLGFYRHITGPQLCEGLRVLALKHWGLIARMVLNHWNVTTTRDFGEIVFLLVNNGWMNKQPQDKIEDFDNVYDFRAAFDGRFEIYLDQ